MIISSQEKISFLSYLFLKFSVNLIFQFKQDIELQGMPANLVTTKENK
jgi:hypothetical protein